MKEISPRLKISYVPQTVDFDGTLKAYAGEIDESYFKAILAKFGFNPRDFENDMNALSEGQKKKVLIAQSLCQKAHLYVWDEPLNYLDFYSRMQIENLIKEFEPTMLFVEHDNAFRQSIANKIIHL